MRSLETCEDARGADTAVLLPSDMRSAVVLAAGVPKAVPVPDGAGTVLFNATGPFWVQYGGGAVLPVADVPAGSAPELSPAARRIAGIATLGLVAPVDAVVSLSFYR